MENVTETLDREIPTHVSGVSHHIVGGIKKEKPQSPKIDVSFALRPLQKNGLSDAIRDTVAPFSDNRLLPSILEFAAADVVFQRVVSSSRATTDTSITTCGIKGSHAPGSNPAVLPAANDSRMDAGLSKPSNNATDA